MIRKIYHGSNRIVRRPGFGTGSTYNDFGLGFYCTDDRSRAAEWATGHTQNGFVSRYSIDTSGLRIINLCAPEYSPLTWLSVLLNYREFDLFNSDAYHARDYLRSVFAIDIQSCDCLVGWRADDMNFIFAQDFLNGRMSLESLASALTSCDLGRQFVLRSNRAFDRLTFDGYNTVHAEDYVPAMLRRERNAMKQYDDNRKKTGVTSPSGLYIHDILTDDIRPYDSRLIVRSYM